MRYSSIQGCATSPAGHALSERKPLEERSDDGYQPIRTRGDVSPVADSGEHPVRALGAARIRGLHRAVELYPGGATRWRCLPGSLAARGGATRRVADFVRLAQPEPAGAGGVARGVARLERGLKRWWAIAPARTALRRP